MALVKVDGYKVISVKLPTIKKHKDTIEPLTPDWMGNTKNCGEYWTEYEFSGDKTKESKYCIVHMTYTDGNKTTINEINTAKIPVISAEKDLYKTTTDIEAVR